MAASRGSGRVRDVPARARPPRSRCEPTEQARDAYYRATERYAWHAADVVPFVERDRGPELDAPARGWTEPGDGDSDCSGSSTATRAATGVRLVIDQILVLAPPAGGRPARLGRRAVSTPARLVPPSRAGRASVAACSRSSTAPSSTPRRRRSRSPTRGCCAATASSRSCASTAGGRSRSTSTSTRMARSAANLRLPFDVDAVRADVEALLDAAATMPDAGAARRRHARRAPDRRSSRRCRAAARDARAGHDHATRRRACSTGVKSLSYGANMLATRLAQEQGADEALLVTPHGRVLEGPTTSFVCVAGRRDARHAAARPSTSSTRSRAGACSSVVDVTRAVDRRRRAAVRAARRSSPRRLREVHPVRTIDGADAAGGARARSRRRAASRIRAHIEQRAGRRRLTLEGPHRHRQPAAVRQGGGRLAPAARRARRAARPHRPALRRRAVDDLRRPSSASRAPSASSASAAARTPSRRRGCSPRSDRCSPTERPDVVLVYGDTNSTLAGGAGRGAGARAGRPRRGGDALVRPRDARGAQPRPHRPPLRPAAVPVADGGRQPRARARRRRASSSSAT